MLDTQHEFSELLQELHTKLADVQADLAKLMDKQQELFDQYEQTIRETVDKHEQTIIAAMSGYNEDIDEALENYRQANINDFEEYIQEPDVEVE